ncbi:MAG: helix-turn-helix domain-containing protein [archaeon]
MFFYSQNCYEEGNKIFYSGSGLVIGSEKNRKEFFSDLKTDERVENLEINNDFFICVYSEKKTSERAEAVKIAYNPRIIFLKPVIIDEEGFEEWEIASVKREDMEAFVKISREYGVEHKLYYLKKQKITNLMIYSMLPKLSRQQKAALLLAVENGYYGYPRKITMEKLAKMMKISVSTYQFHLAKAESKLMPFAAKAADSQISE